MNAEILAVGTEILLGSLVDTNTAWLSQRLAASGFEAIEDVPATLEERTGVDEGGGGHC